MCGYHGVYGLHMAVGRYDFRGPMAQWLAQATHNRLAEGPLTGMISHKGTMFESYRAHFFPLFKGILVRGKFKIS